MENIESLISRKYKYPENLTYQTLTTQAESEDVVLKKYLKCLDCSAMLALNTVDHEIFLTKMLHTLPSNLSYMDSLRVWSVYWIFHSLELMNIQPDRGDIESVITFLASCQNQNGGFGGGPGQCSHLSSTYAAISALCIIGVHSKRSYAIIDTESLKKFIYSCRIDDGSFRVGEDQEDDLRAVYCALTVCRLLNIYSADMFQGSAQYIKSCQNYDGGFGAQKGLESNAGYTFCAYASLVMLSQEEIIDRENLLNWACHRQLSMEGGFQGRVAKLVDSCYSYWCGSLFQLLQGSCEIYENYTPHNLFNKEAVQYYLAICCQSLSGGFSDRYNRNPDLYHTCYALSGLALSQRSIVESKEYDRLIGIKENLLIKNDPIYNISELSAHEAHLHFY